MKDLFQIRLLVASLCCALVVSCTSGKEPDAQQIVDEAIAVHGGAGYDRIAVAFKFRDRQYRALRDNGAFVYSRSFTDSTGQQVHDVLRNSGFERTINDSVTAVTEERSAAFGASVNSVIYFALLPYFLNDAAVQKEYVGDVVIKGEPYYKVKVTFQEEGGGEGFEDVYVYWFHQGNKTMDYLAYSFRENDGGTRFREAVNPRKVGGILFQDYINYTLKEGIELEKYDEAFEAGKLHKLSEISLEEIQVSGLPQE